VFCKDYTDAELNAYLDTDEPYDKAGAYAILGIFAKHIDHYEGSFDTVVGFPWDIIEEKLKAFAK
jgi:septum formation protein